MESGPGAMSGVAVAVASGRMIAASVLAAGSLSDRFGRKGMLLAGLSVFGLASLAGGLMDTPGQLIAARSVMGVGAAMVFPSTLSLISNVFTERGERARAIGLWGAITGAAIALGPIVGGWLLEVSDWRSIFFAMHTAAHMVEFHLLRRRQRLVERLERGLLRVHRGETHRHALAHARFAFGQCGAMAHVGRVRGAFALMRLRVLQHDALPALEQRTLAVGEIELGAEFGDHADAMRIHVGAHARVPRRHVALVLLHPFVMTATVLLRRRGLRESRRNAHGQRGGEKKIAEMSHDCLECDAPSVPILRGRSARPH